MIRNSVQVLAKVEWIYFHFVPVHFVQVLLTESIEISAIPYEETCFPIIDVLL